MVEEDVDVEEELVVDEELLLSPPVDELELDLAPFEEEDDEDFEDSDRESVR